MDLQGTYMDKSANFCGLKGKKYFTKNVFTHRNKRKEKSRMSKIGVRRLRSRLTILYKKLYSYKHYLCLRKKIHPTG